MLHIKRQQLFQIKSDGGVVTWKFLDTDIARIAGNKVEGLKAGHTVAVATAPDGSSVGVSVKVWLSLL